MSSLRTQNQLCQGPAGAIEYALDHPAEPPRAWALVLHPHPLHGGSRDNKVVTTVARACVQAGLLAVRPNFRGVGGSQGEFDAARGETADMLAVVQNLYAEMPELASIPWVLAGFSFGTAVAAQLFAELAELGLPMPARLILVGSAVERFRYRELAPPADTVLIHGEQDEIVPLAEAMEFARAHGLPITVIPDASHFFHGRLLTLRQLVLQAIAGIGA